MIDKLNAVSDSGGIPARDLPHIGRYHGDSGTTPSFAIILAWIIISGGYWIVNHTQTMRMLGSRSIWDMKMAAVFGVALSMPIMVGCATLGVFGRALYPDFAQPDQLYPLMANEYLGAGLKGLVVAGILAAAISTFDSMGSALSAVFTRDIYARLIRPEQNDAHYLKVGRWATVGILALGFAYLPFISSKDTMLKAFLTLIPVFVTPLFTLYLVGVFTRAHPRSGVIGIGVGALFGLVALYDREMSDLVWLPSWLTGRWEALSWSMLVTAAAMGLTTLKLGVAQTLEQPRPANDNWLAESRRELSITRELPDQVPSAPRVRPEWFAAALILFTAWLVFGAFW